ncbi:MAG: protein kinase domain-containing protein [Thermoguttaceae bacterium]
MLAPKTCRSGTDWQALIDGTLPGDEQARAASHLETCEECRQRLESIAGPGGLVSTEAVASGELGMHSEALEAVVRRLKIGLERPGAASCGDSSESGLLAVADHSRLPARLGGYEVLEVVGRGGMGTVLKARDRRLERLVAIKVLNPELASSGPARLRFLREARAAAAISHDHVVTIHAVDDSGQVPLLVMEYVEGISLERLIRQAGRLPLEQVVQIAMQAASGLAAAHDLGLVHRDIKPSNILLETRSGRVKIADFGLVRVLHEAESTQTDAVAGTPPYMSPEQTRGEPVEHRSDLFSLGCVMYAMCVGRSPFRAETPAGVIRQVCEGVPAPVCQANPAIPDWLAAIIDRLLAKRPEDRYQSAGEVAALLEWWLGHLRDPSRTPLPPDVSAPKAARPGAGARRAQRRWTGVATGCLVLVLCCGFALSGSASRLPKLWRDGASPTPLPAQQPPAAGNPLPAAGKTAQPAEAALPGDARRKQQPSAGPETLPRIVDEDMHACYAAANRYAYTGQWKLAAAEIAQFVKDDPRSLEHRRALAVAQLMGGDIQGYKAGCTDAFRRLAGCGPFSKTFLVQLGCLSADSGVDIGRIAGLVKEVNPREISAPRYRETLAFYLFRSGRDEELLAMSVAADAPPLGPSVFLLKAMARQRSKADADSGQHLREAVLRIEKDFPAPKTPSRRNLPDPWIRWGLVQIVLGQSRQMLPQEQVAQTDVRQTDPVLEGEP